MSEYDELVDSLRRLLTEKFSPKPEFIRGLLGDGQGNVEVSGRSDKSYVRFARGSTEFFEIFNRTVTPVNDWPVLIGELPWQPGLTQVVDTDWSVYEQSGWGDNLGNTSPHAPTHEWPDGSPGSDPLNVHLRAIVPGRAYLSSTGTTTIFVNSLEYEYNETGTVWAGTPGIDLVPVISDTVTGTMRYAGVYIEPTTNALTVITGSTTVYSDALTPPLVSFPGGVVPIARVKIYGGQAAISEADITDAKRPFNPTIDTSVFLRSVNNLSDVADPTGSFDNIKQPATDTYLGVMRFGTQAEVSTGTVDNVAVTPLTLKNVPLDHLQVSELQESDGGGVALSADANGDLAAAGNITVDNGEIIFNNSEQTRHSLTANRTYYVDTSLGNDSNDGLSSGAGAFATLQKAINVASALDNGGYDITIDVANGTYSEAITLKSFVGSGTITIDGDTTTPSNVILNSGTSFTADGVLGVYIVQGLQLSGAGFGINSKNGSVVRFQAIDFAGTSAPHLHTESFGVVQAVGNYSISGSTNRHIDMDFGGLGTINGVTITVSGTPAFSSAYCFQNTGSIGNFAGCTFSGSATGVRYSISGNAVCNTGGGGASYFPGNSAGSTATGGQYI